jgi:queuosine precursor transporter
MTDTLTRTDAKAVHQFRNFDIVMAAFVAILLLSNVIGAAKMAVFHLPLFGDRVAGAGILFFPLSYVIGDILTEVYGYSRARRCIWVGFGALGFLAFMAWAVVALDPAPGWPNQPAYVTVFGSTWRIVIASVTAFWLGEFVNSFVLARMKIATGGKYLWTRTISSTVFGQGVDSLIFYPIAFYATDGFSNANLAQAMLNAWIFKVLWEILLTPVTYAVVGWLKRREGVDVFDEGTDFTPFRTRV